MLHDFVELGNSVLVIEHNLDMGPEGGAGGGLVIAEGSPEKLAKNHLKTGSYTGKYLEKELALHKK